MFQTTNQYHIYVHVCGSTSHLHLVAQALLVAVLRLRSLRSLRLSFRRQRGRWEGLNFPRATMSRSWVVYGCLWYFNEV